MGPCRNSCNKLSNYSSFPMNTISATYKVCRSKKVSTLGRFNFYLDTVKRGYQFYNLTPPPHPWAVISIIFTVVLLFLLEKMRGSFELQKILTFLTKCNRYLIDTLRVDV